MKTELLATLRLKDEKEISIKKVQPGEIASVIPKIDIIGAHLFVAPIVEDDEEQEPSSLKFASPVLAKEGVKLKPLVCTVVALATVPGQTSTWAMVGSEVLTERRSRSTRRIKDSDYLFSVREKPTVVVSDYFVNKSLALSRSLRLGFLSSFSFHSNIIVVATHGGIRVYNLLAMFKNREVVLSQAAQSIIPPDVAAAAAASTMAAVVDTVSPPSVPSKTAYVPLRVCIGSLGGIID